MRKKSKTNISKYDRINRAVFSLIDPQTTVLDVGCWSGSLGKALIRDKKCVIDGIDFSKEALIIAKKNKLRNVYQRDLNDLKRLKVLPNKYDFIVFADVLEHVLYPEIVLNYYVRYLKKNGHIVVSLPNIAFILYRVKLLLGKFEYKEVGVMDKTHIKFYTLSTMMQFFENQNFTIKKIEKYNDVSPKLILLQFLKHVIPGLFTLQFVFLLERKNKSIV